MSERLIIRTTGQTGPSGGGGGGGGANLSYTASPTQGVVVSDSGTDATIPLADGTNAGLMSPAQRTAVNALAATYQPLDSDLTAIAALSTTSYGRALLALADLAALQAVVGPTGTPSASTFLRGDGSWATPAGGGGGDLLASNNLSDVANAATALSNLGGQPVDSDLTAIAALSTTSFGRSLLTLADAAAGRTALGLGTMATQAATTYVTVATADASYQPLDSQLTALAGATSGADQLPYFTGATTAASTSFTAYARTLLDDADAPTARATLGVVAASDTASGLVELATTAETTTGTDTARAVTPAGVQAVRDLLVPQAQSVNAQTGTTYTLVAGDAGKLVTLSNASAITLTVPQDSDATIAVGTYVDLYQLGAGQVTVVAGTGATLRVSGLTAKARAQYSRLGVQKVSANTWSLFGDLAAS